MRGVDPSLSAESVGFVDPDTWDSSIPGSGLTSNNLQVASDKAAGRATTRRGQDLGVQNANSRNAAIVQAAGMNAGKPTAASIEKDALDTPPDQRTPDQQAIVNHATATGRRNRPNYTPTPSNSAPRGSIAPGTIPPNINPKTLPVLTPQDAANLAKNHPGKHMFFRTIDGRIAHN